MPAESAEQEELKRRPHRKGVATRAAILRVAEQMFAEHGLDGASLREITAVAEVDLALVNYHFKSKDRLYRKVIIRRAVVINRARQRALAKAGDDPGLDQIVDAFLDPIILRVKSRDLGWRHYGVLAVQISNSRRFDDLRREYFDPTAELFVDAFARFAPCTNREKFYWAYIFMVGCMVQALGATGRFTLLTENSSEASWLDTARDELRRFVIGGVRNIIER